jgi:hypothetical protein
MYLYEDYVRSFLLRKGCTLVLSVSRRALQLQLNLLPCSCRMLQALRVSTLIYEFSYFRTFSLFIQRSSVTEGYLQSTPLVLVALFFRPSFRLSALGVILATEQEYNDMLRIGRWHLYNLLLLLRLRLLPLRYVPLT